MHMTIAEADNLVERCMQKTGFNEEEARTITDQIIDSEVRGASYAGMSRALSIIERVKSNPPPRPMRVEKETPVSALIDGGDTCGYLVASEAVRMGIAKAKESGVAVIGANNTWYTGMYVHYLEEVARANLVGMAMGGSGPTVAPHGASEGRFGTNPIAFCFPTTNDPIIFDAGTSAIVVADAVMAQRLGRSLPEDTAYDSEGNETVDPTAALSGAFKVWGGHRGSGLALVVQLFGVMVGGAPMPQGYKENAFFFMAVKPDLFMDPKEFKSRAFEYAELVRAARPVAGGAPVRMPFDRSAETRRKILANGGFSVPDALVDALESIATD
jgi:LDH2 family malate/lactate/ureidoglycolate dehydrogenase